MKITASVITILVALAFMGTAIASMPGKSVEYEGGAVGKVVFDGQSHADAGLSCGECHPGLFEMAVVAEITMADHNEGTFCFSCHQDGGTAFPGTDCAACHQK